MRDRQGGFIGATVTPTTGAASGVWTLREAERFQRGSTWPVLPFAPSDVAGLQLWLDASETSTLYDATSGGSLVAADGSVARWEDRSGNGNHATQSTSGSRPVRRTAGLNSAPSVQFVADDVDNGDWLGVASTSGLNGASGLGIFCVYSTSTTGSNRALAGKWPGTGENVTPSWVFGWSGSSSATTATMFVHNGSDVQTAATTTNFNDGTPRLLGLVNTSSQLQARMNGAVQGTNNSTVTTDASSTAGVVIGGYNSYSLSSGQRLMSCHIAELLIYNATLTSGQVTNIESYLMTKWSIT